MCIYIYIVSIDYEISILEWILGGGDKKKTVGVYLSSL